MHKSHAVLLPLFVAAAAALADAPYEVDLGTSLRSGSLSIEPTVTGPAGKTLRYEMRVRKEGGAGNSSSSQSGTVRLGDDGRAELASNSVSVAPDDRAVITVRLFDGARVVAERSTQYP